MNALYNEIEPFACDWLEELERRGHIAPGRVERRSISDLTAAGVAGPGQRHFFAGIGVWSAALRDAGVPDDASIWTGSCPCQPFSAAGTRSGTSDPRHLWPAWFALIEQCRPAVIFGEQVASADGLGWLDLVFADLERCGYSVGAADMCAAGVGAPHIRQRLFFVAYAAESGRIAWRGQSDQGDGRDATRIEPRRLLDAGELGNSDRLELRGHARASNGTQATRGHQPDRDDADPSGATRGFWSSADWIHCLDGKSRPVEPGTFPLAHGAPARVGRLRGYGNAIVRQVATAFIKASLDAIGELT